MKAWLVVVILSIGGGPVAAQEAPLPAEFVGAEPRVQLYMAYAQFKMARHQMARRMWEQIDGAGAAEAAFNLGVLYEQGLGVAVDRQRAGAYYRDAARAGSRGAAYQLGLLHLSDPQLVSADEARHWLSVAALDGDADAGALLKQLLDPAAAPQPLTQVRLWLSSGETERALAHLEALVAQQPPLTPALTLLGWLYERGLGVGQDIDRAGQLFRQAAEAGDAEAQYALAVMLETGVGQPQDRPAAQRWLRRAAAQGYPPAVDKLVPSD